MYKYGKIRGREQRCLCYAQGCPTKTFRLEYRYEWAKTGISEKIIAMAANASGIRAHDLQKVEIFYKMVGYFEMPQISKSEKELLMENFGRDALKKVV